MKCVTIKKGRHRPCTIIPSFFRNLRIDRDFEQIINMELVFDETCRYHLDNNDQYDWNKLYGWSFGIDGIHQNSIRFVWRYNENEDLIEIAPYAYINGERIYPNQNQIAKVKIGELISTQISVLDNKVKTKIIEPNPMISDFIFEDCHEKVLFGCWFYFGGNNKAPQKIKINYQKS